MLDTNLFAMEIVDNATLEAENIIGIAKKESEAVLSALERDLKVASEKSCLATEKKVDTVLSQSKALAKIEVPKIILEAKNKAVDNVYEIALKELLAKPDKEYFTLLEKWIQEHANDGDKVIFAKNDIKKVPKGFVEAIATKKKIKLAISDKTHESSGGIILEGKIYDQNLTFEAVLSLVRTKTEKQVAEALFEY
ncbi:MAG: V-type ATP synthase subunit E [Firmicutes bacterium]|nr:V-type ATP synthase subunit E [Bacillota bacterium]